MLEQIRVADPENFYQTTFLGLFQLAHNTQKVGEAEAPKSWTDLLDPK